MRTSDDMAPKSIPQDAVESVPAARVPRWLSRLGRAIAIIAMIVCLDMGLTHVLQPTGGATEIVWWDYAQQEDTPITTLFLGSSYAASSFDPLTFDEVTGGESFSFATIMQSTDSAKQALERALADHDISRVYFGFGYWYFEQEPSASAMSTFTSMMSQHESPPEALVDWLELATNPALISDSSSVMALFPFSFNHVDFTPEAIQRNLELKASGATPLEAARIQDPASSYTYYGRGHYYQDDEFYFAFAQTFRIVEHDYPVRMDEGVIASFRDFCAFCREQGVELYVVATPMPSFCLLSLQNHYPREMGRIRAIAEEEGAVYLDFTLAKPELFDCTDYAFFRDPQHLNGRGSVAFSRALGEIALALDRGEDVSALFYSFEDWDAYLHSIDRITLVAVDAEADATGIVVTPTLFASPDVSANYRVWIRPHFSDDEYTLALDWCDAVPSDETRAAGTAGTIHVDVAEPGTYDIKIDARQWGHEDPFPYSPEALGVEFPG